MKKQRATQDKRQIKMLNSQAIGIVFDDKLYFYLLIDLKMQNLGNHKRRQIINDNCC